MVIGAALLHATWNALVKVNGDRLFMMAIIMGSQSIIALMVLPFVEFPPSVSWPYIWMSVGLHNAYYLSLVLAYRYGDLSHVYPIARGTSPLIVAFVSVVFVGEILSQQATISIALIAIGIMSLALTKNAEGVRDPKALFSALGCGIFIAGYTIVDGLGARLAGNAHSYTFWLFAIDGLPLMALVLFLKRGKVFKGKQQTWLVGTFAGIVSLIAYWIVIWAMTQAPMALVSAIRETSMVFAILFGVFFLKERLNLARLVSTIVTLAGAVMLKSSK